MTCSTCIHFLSRGVIDASANPADPRFQMHSKAAGICRRYPPKLESVTWNDLGPDPFSAFPAVHQNQQCGEFSSAVPL